MRQRVRLAQALAHEPEVLVQEIERLAGGEPSGVGMRIRQHWRSLLPYTAVLDLDRLKALYADRTSGINNAGTYGCTIMLLGERPELHISPGRPDVAPFQRLEFSPQKLR